MSSQRRPLTPKVGKALVAFHILSPYRFFPAKKPTVVRYSENAFRQEKSVVVKSAQARELCFQSNNKKATMHRAIEGKNLATKASLEHRSLKPAGAQWEHTSVIKSRTDSRTTIPLFTWLYMSSLTSLSVSVFLLSYFCCHFCLVYVWLLSISPQISSK